MADPTAPDPFPDFSHPNTLPEPPRTADLSAACAAGELTVPLSLSGVRPYRRGFPSPPARASLPEVPGYLVTGEIARGGMGVVYAARDLGLTREVAIKMLLPELAGDPEMEAQFEREGRITARLPHPGVPPVHALGRLPDGRPFLVMKLIRGRTLAAILAARWSRPAQFGAELDMTTPDAPGLLNVFEQICQAVGFAHSQGIVHRDLKPHNVMVGPFGEVQVMDWGLATAEGRGQRTEDGQTRTHGLAPRAGAGGEGTVAGRAKGTPSYMAPEQARGEWGSVDARADVFALGGILCAMLTGKPPHTGEQLQDVIAKAEAGEVGEACARLDACGADAELVRLAKWCLHPERAERPPNAVAVAGLVEVYRLGQEDRVRALEARRAAAAAHADVEARRAEAAAEARKATVVLAVQAACRAETERVRERLRRYTTAAVALAVGVIVGLATTRLWKSGPPDGAVPPPNPPASCHAAGSP